MTNENELRTNKTAALNRMAASPFGGELDVCKRRMNGPPQLLVNKLVVGLAVLLGLSLTGPAIYWQMILRRALNEDLGFQHGSPYVKLGPSRIGTEVLVLEEVAPEGVVDRAGGKQGDIVLGFSTAELYRFLERSRGTKVSLRVVLGGDGPPLNMRPIRELSLQVPDSNHRSNEEGPPGNGE